MGTINNLDRGLFIWGGSILLPSVVAGTSYGNAVAFFIFIWLAMVISFPAFIFFSVLLHWINSRNWNTRRKKYMLLLSNYTGIFLTFLFVPVTGKPVLLYYLAGIIVCSTVFILLVPLRVLTHR